MLLLELIQSLSKSEKRYFKLFAQLGRKDMPKYVKLFDLLNKQTSIDDEYLKKKKFNADDKNLLTEKLLDCIHLFKLRKTIDSELNLYQSCFSIMYNKNQWPMLSKYIRRAKKLAVEHELYGKAIEINKWETNMLFKIEKNELGKKIDILINELKEFQTNYNEILNYKTIKNQLDILMLNDNALVKSKSKEQFEHFFQSPLLEKANPPSTVRAQLEYYFIYCYYYRHQNDMEALHQYFIKLVDLFDQNEFLFHIDDYATFYIKIVHWEKAVALKINKIPYTKDTDIEAKLPNSTLFTRYNINIQELTYNTRILDREAGEKQVKLALENWEQYTKYIKGTKLAVFSYTIMVFYGLFEDWENANFWLAKVTSVSRVTDRKDVQIAARIWNLMINYELEPYELDKHAQAAFKFFVRNECYTDFEEQAIKLFRTLYKAINKKEKTAAFLEMLAFYDQIDGGDISNKRGVGNFKIWCEARAKQITIPELIKEYRAQKKELTFF